MMKYATYEVWGRGIYVHLEKKDTGDPNKYPSLNLIIIGTIDNATALVITSLSQRRLLVYYYCI